MDKTFLLGLAMVAALSVPNAAAASDRFAAIAYSLTTGHFGYGYDFDTEQGASARALAGCQNAGGRWCEVAVWSRGGCAALAGYAGMNSIRDTGISYGYSDRSGAQQRALTECRYNSRGKACSVIAWVCNSN